MKKNVMMRLSALLLVAVLLTTCVISGTFAKYVKSDTETDTARVAKWGVTVDVAGDEVAVKDTFDGNAEADIKSNTGELLAPGTAGQLLEVTISGTPEVAVEVTYEATVTLTGWEASGAYYFPVEVFIDGTAVTIVDKDSDLDVDADDAEACIKEAIEACTQTYDAGAPLTAEKIVITWEWAFSTSGANDLKDTALGDAATAPSISIELTVTVTQID